MRGVLSVAHVSAIANASAAARAEAGGRSCGACEVVRLKVKHIDSAQKIIRIEQSKGRKDFERGTEIRIIQAL